MSEEKYIEGETYEFPEGFFKCIVVDGKTYFEKVRSHPPKITIEDIPGGYVFEGGWLLFPDGSSKERLSGVKHEPSPDPYQAALAIARYWQIKLDLAVQEFSHCKTKLLGQTKAALRQQTPPPGAEQLDRLQLLKARVEVLKQQFEKVEADVESAKPDNLRGKEELAAQNAQNCADAASAIQSIEV
jgi:hypothetical protein